jgi:hypothetical protein
VLSCSVAIHVVICVVIRSCHIGASSGGICGCHVVLSHWVVIRGRHQGMSSEDVIRDCHQGMSSGVVICFFIRYYHPMLSFGVVTRFCLSVLTFGFVIRCCYSVLSFSVVIWRGYEVFICGCHIGLSFGVVIWVVIWICKLTDPLGCHLFFHSILSCGDVIWCCHPVSSDSVI